MVRYGGDPVTEIEEGVVDIARTDRVIARRLAVSRAVLRAWRHRGYGPPFCRFGRSIRYLDSDIDAFIEASRVTPSTVNRQDRSNVTGT